MYHQLDYSSLKCIGYARKSNEAEDKQVQSIDDQKTIIANLEEQHSFQVIDIEVDEKSAKSTLVRDGFNSLIKRIERGEVDTIICWKPNRLARNMIDGGTIIDYLSAGTIKAIITPSKIWLPTDNMIPLAVEFSMAKEGSREISTDVKRGQRLKAQRGWFPASYLPLGYQYNDGYKKNGEDPIIPDDNFHLLVQLWDEAKEKSYSIADIKRRGDQLGIRIQKGKTKGQPVSYNTYSKTFTNPFYASGEFWWKTDDNGNKEKFYGKHPKMLTEANFNRIQLVLGERGRPTRLNHYNAPLNGCLTCGECGCAFTEERVMRVTCTKCNHRFSIKTSNTCNKCGITVAEMKNPVIYDRAYYRCTKKRGACSQKYIESTEAEKQFQDKLSQIEISKEFHDWAIAGFQFLHKEEISKQDDFNRSVTKKETELVNQLRNLTLMRSRDEITAGEFQDSKQLVNEELGEVRKSKKDYHQKIIDWTTVAEQYTEYATTAPTEFANASNDRKREILKMFGSNLIVRDGKLDFTAPQVLTGLKQAEYLYKNKKDTLEPLETYTVQGFSGDFAPAIEGWLAKLRKVRTTIINSYN